MLARAKLTGETNVEQVQAPSTALMRRPPDSMEYATLSAVCGTFRDVRRTSADSVAGSLLRSGAIDLVTDEEILDEAEALYKEIGVLSNILRAKERKFDFLRRNIMMDRGGFKMTEALAARFGRKYL